ncbi:MULTISPECIES: acetyl-CoA C-acetyltransferase [unclassified Shinella]|uniref:acetyl-CoA C-acetyltransferase n=1 Tax=unclassified Shinella TaxID=2643062 RepID=UPI00234E4CBC|nr:MULTISPECIES: acetyl-CoA C-acetyltransferase [unclassified Shinella]MDC7259650.1 acetyl-CoA C-acetyltransferase [Shinella sp. YE25]MDC7266846.1 acetyl-CoA C-acetyltransferase [Shinella sp. HY16]MDC7273743.1 acetyl-CoA C-acetyltransferase [Shinella sp. YZ44]CAK7261901.1 putative acyltransferase [Shinella sp. WSC3-e]
MKSVVIVGAARTPVGSFLGPLGTVPAHELGAVAIAAALERAGIDPGSVNEVILGQVLTAGAGQNPARQASVLAGVPKTATALSVNQVCGSGLRAVALGANEIMSGGAAIIVAGGQESMSLAPHCQAIRTGVKMGNVSLIDTMISDGLTDAFGAYHMGVTAENVAKQFVISRIRQDDFALESQRKAAAAQGAGHFREEIAPVTIETRKGSSIVDTDDHLRPETTREALEKLRPAFQKDGTVTAGNASGLNDGAAALLLMSEDEAARRNLTPLARIAGWATAGVEPALMGTGPIPASRNALINAGWRIDELDRIEANEAFAAQACAVNDAMGWDPVKVNVNGGAIALGHPIGASGARVLVTLLYELRRSGTSKGLATLCIGGGMGIAMCVEAMGRESLPLV